MGKLSLGFSASVHLYIVSSCGFPRESKMQTIICCKERETSLVRGSRYTYLGKVTCTPKFSPFFVSTKQTKPQYSKYTRSTSKSLSSSISSAVHGNQMYELYWEASRSITSASSQTHERCTTLTLQMSPGLGKFLALLSHGTSIIHHQHKCHHEVCDCL